MNEELETLETTSLNSQPPLVDITVGCQQGCEYVPTESDPRSNMISVVCTKCWRGASIDPSTHVLRNGKIVPLT